MEGLKPISELPHAQKPAPAKLAETIMIGSYISFAVYVTIVVVTAIFASMAVAIPIGIVFGLLALSSLIAAIIYTMVYHGLINKMDRTA
jgi:hypothetical protein